MPDFVWTVKDKNGKRLLVEQTAETAGQGKAELIAAGCTEIALQENEVISEVLKGFRHSKLPGRAAVRHKRRNQPPMTLRGLVGQLIRQNRAASIAFFLAAAYLIYEGDILAMVWGGFAMLFWSGYWYWLKWPNLCNRKTLKALDWHHWEEALRLVKKLSRINRFHRIKIPGTILVRYRAKALAGQGRLTEALQDFAACENQPGCPSWLYFALVADIYDTVKARDQALEFARKALAANKIPTTYIGLATRLLRCQKDPAEVKAALAEAEKGVLVEDTERPNLLLCHGDVARVEKDYSTARQHYLSALEIMERTPHQPLRDGQISRAKARLCCVLAALGDLPAAKQYFAEAREYMLATKPSELLEECEQALGKTNL